MKEEESKYVLKPRKNNILLTDDQISILQRNGIDYREYPSSQSLVFRIEEELNENPDSDMELELLSEELSERNYYHDTNK